LEVKSRGKKYWCGAGKTGHASAAGLQRQRAVARLNGDAFGLQAVRRDVSQRALGVVEATSVRMLLPGVRSTGAAISSPAS
jgi:hypothetical protein